MGKSSSLGHKLDGAVMVKRTVFEYVRTLLYWKLKNTVRKSSSWLSTISCHLNWPISQVSYGK